MRIQSWNSRDVFDPSRDGGGAEILTHSPTISFDAHHHHHIKLSSSAAGVKSRSKAFLSGTVNPCLYNLVFTHMQPTFTILAGIYPLPNKGFCIKMSLQEAKEQSNDDVVPFVPHQC